VGKSCTPIMRRGPGPESFFTVTRLEQPIPLRVYDRRGAVLPGAPSRHLFSHAKRGPHGAAFFRWRNRVGARPENSGPGVFCNIEV
jgi:hypothetical protein